MPAVVRNVTVKASNLVRHWWGSYMSDNQVGVKNTENQITIESVYYPLAGSMDVKLYKPLSNVFFRGIEIHPVAEVILPKRMAVPRSVLAAPGRFNHLIENRNQSNTKCVAHLRRLLDWIRNRHYL